MSERTAPPVLLDGDWPRASPGYSHLPTTPIVMALTSWAFRVYAYLVSLGYSQDGLSPLPEDVARDLVMPRRAVKAAFCDLASAGLLSLMGDVDGPIETVVLHLPVDVK